MSRLLLVSFQQAVRSITLALLPIAFISLLVWATAGSSNGNTADPLRAALWLFLAAHHVPLQLSLSNQTISGVITFLPLGALLVPYWTAKSGYNRMVEILGIPNTRTKRLYILDYALCYSIVAYVISLLAMGSTVYVPFYIAIPILFAVCALFTYLISDVLPDHGNSLPWQRALKFATIALIFLIGIATLLLTISLAWHFTTVVNLTQVIAPGIIGGIAFLLIQILYLPNIAVATLSYLSGAGLTLGGGTHISPLIHRIDEIPAIPLLGALPVVSNPWMLILAIVPVSIGVVMASYARRTYIDFTEIKRFLIASHIFIFVFSIGIALVAGGELLSSNLDFVGALWWLMPIAITLESALGLSLAIGIPLLISRVKASRAEI
jgi:Family of unknown function (DUF6350)